MKQLTPSRDTAGTRRAARQRIAGAALAISAALGLAACAQQPPAQAGASASGTHGGSHGQQSQQAQQGQQGQQGHHGHHGQPGYQGHHGHHGQPGYQGHHGHHGTQGEGGMHMGGSGQLMRMLEAAGASEAQRAQIRQIAMAASADTRPLHEEMRSLRRQAMQLLAAPRVDAAAAEQLRQRILALHDRISARTTRAMLDAANVLTPEQRARLAEHVGQRGEGMSRHHMAPQGTPGAR